MEGSCLHVDVIHVEVGDHVVELGMVCLFCFLRNSSVI